MNNVEKTLDEEIDLRPYIELLIRRWYIIMGAALLGGLIAFGVTSLQDKVYQATALIAITETRLIAQFDPRFGTSEEPQPRRILPELAVSDDIVKELLDTIDPPLEEIETITELRRLLEATQGETTSLIRLAAEHTNPADAARITNHWAAIFVIKAIELFGGGAGEQLTFFEDQLSHTEEELSSVEAALVEFQGVNRQTILGNQVSALKELQERLLKDLQTLDKLESNIQNLKAHIAETDSADTLSLADQLTALILQLRVFNATLTLPIQLQLDGSSGLSGTTVDEQEVILDDLQGTVISRLTTTEAELSELEPQLLDLQEELKEAQVEDNRLHLNKDIAQETYRSLARKVDEERITSNDMIQGIRLASQAAVPEKPEGGRRLYSIMGAAVFAAALAMAVIIALFWWKKEGEQT